MSYLPVTIFAYFLNSLAVVADKFLLKRYISDPLIYIFYFSFYSLLAIVLTPFTRLPGIDVFLLASTSTLLWTFGAYLMFKALQSGQISRVIPVIGTLTPLFLFIHASVFGTITANQAWAVGFLISGLILLTLADWRGKLQMKEFIFEFFASLLFASSYLFLRQAYLQQDFLTVLVWSRVILFPVGVIIFVVPALRIRIFSSKGLRVNFKSRLGILFMGGQLAGGLSELLLTFSISLATPALVNSLQGVQYIFLLLFSLILAKKFPKVFEEKSNFWIFSSKALGIIVIAIGLFALSFEASQKIPKLGVTYSPLYASQLGLNPQTTFTHILDDLKVKTVRLPIYWSDVEKFPMHLNFASTDYYLNEAQKRGVQVILVLGYKQPRWPECFAPEWINKSTREVRMEKIINLVQKEVGHFKHFPNLVTWQIENEPFLYYGVCDKVTTQTEQLLKKEIQTVKSLDYRPILITDSGELSIWIEAARNGDMFGYTLYRQVWSPYFGFVDYPLPPIFYTLKGEFIKLLIASPAKKIIISELQAEPWIPLREDAFQVNPDKQVKLFPVSKFASNIEYAKETRAEEAILWGVEWWYYMAKMGHPEYLEYANKIFKSN